MAKAQKDEEFTVLLTRHNERMQPIVAEYIKAWPKDQLEDILPMIVRDVMLYAKDCGFNPVHIHEVGHSAYSEALKQAPSS